MKCKITTMLFLLGLLGGTLAVQSDGQALVRTRAEVMPATPRDVPVEGTVPAKSQVLSELRLLYYDFSNAAVFPPSGVALGGDFRAVGMFFDSPFAGKVTSVDFALLAPLTGTGKLRVKMYPGDEVLGPLSPGIDSLDVDFADLRTNPGVVIGNLSNQIDVSGLAFDVEAGKEYFMQLTLVDDSNDASLTFVFDGGTTDTSDTRYNPPRSFVYAITPQDEEYLAPIFPGSDLQFLNVAMEIVVEVPPAPPVFTSTPVTDAVAGSMYTYIATASDNNQDPLLITAPTLPDWLSFLDNGDGTARLRGTPTAQHVGDHEVTLEVADGVDGTDTQTFTVTVRPRPIARVQFIHNALLPGNADVDIFVNNQRVADDLVFQGAASFAEVDVGMQTIDVTDGKAEGNSEPMFSTTGDFAENGTYIAALVGRPGQDMGVALKEVTASTDPIRLLPLHGGVDAGPLDFRLLDASTQAFVQTLADDLAFGSFADLVPVTPGVLNVEVTSGDNSTQVDVYALDLVNGAYTAASDAVMVLMTSGVLGGDPPFTLLGVLNIGQSSTQIVPLPVVTATEEHGGVPATFALHGNYPNPFNPTTTIVFDLDAPGFTTLNVFDLLGREVTSLVSEALPAGTHEVEFNAAGLPSGPYIYRLESGGRTQQNMLMLVK